MDIVKKVLESPELLEERDKLFHTYRGRVLKKGPGKCIVCGGTFRPLSFNEDGFGFAVPAWMCTHCGSVYRHGVPFIIATLIYDFLWRRPNTEEELYDITEQLLREPGEESIYETKKD